MSETFELTSGPFAENPYPLVNRLREEKPIFWHERLNAYVVSRYEDVKFVIEESSIFFTSPGAKPIRPALSRTDGEQHKRLRRLVTPAFSPRALAKTVEPMLSGTANDLIDKFISRGVVDLVEEFADPMVLLVTNHLLNVSPLNNPWLMQAQEELLGAESDPSNVELAARYDANVERLEKFFTETVEKERRNPSGTLLSDMVAAEEEGDRLTTAELVASAEMFTRAATETTKRMIPSLIYALLRHPDQMKALLDDPSLLKPAIEEGLRYYPPNQIRIRYVGSDVAIQGVTIKAGTTIYALKGGANRDPRVWRDPELFDIRRFTERGMPSHMSFGGGPHHCLGAALARMEIAYAIEAILTRMRDLRLDPKHDVRFVGFRNRGPESLRLLFLPAPANQALRKTA